MGRVLLAALPATCCLGLGCRSSGGDLDSGVGPDDSDPGSDLYVRGEGSLTDGTRFELDRPCHVTGFGWTTPEGVHTQWWALQGHDPEVAVGVEIAWKDEYVTGPGTFEANEGDSDVMTSILRQDPDDPAETVGTSATGGTVTFDAVTNERGSVVEGSFDVALDRDEPDDRVHIAISGLFRCRIPLPD